MNARKRRGLVPKEQQIQAAAVAGDDWLGHAERRDPLILIGDFNAVARSVVWRTFAVKLNDATKGRRGEPRIATFPSQAPILRIDHVLLSEALRPLCTACTIDREERKREQPSDHAPVIATLDLARA